MTSEPVLLRLPGLISLLWYIMIGDHCDSGVVACNDVTVVSSKDEIRTTCMYVYSSFNTESLDNDAHRDIHTFFY